MYLATIKIGAGLERNMAGTCSLSKVLRRLLDFEYKLDPVQGMLLEVVLVLA